MRLDVTIDEKTHWIDVPDELLVDAEAFFEKMDHDMDGGWRMGPEYIENPNAEQRIQIVADRLLGAMSVQNQALATMMAAYILKRMPGISGVRIDTGGELLNTELIYDNAAARPAAPVRARRKLSHDEAVAQAGKDVSTVYKVGKGYRFARLEPRTGQWVESPLIANEEEARALRMEAFDERYEQLIHGAE